MIASNLARNRRMELAQKVHRRRHNHTQRDRNKESGVSVRTDKEARSCGHEQQKSLAASVEERTSSHDTRRHGMDESPDKGVARTAETRKNDSIGVDD